jgi:hypothetical protein
MSLPSNALFNRVATVNLSGRLFSHPPFSIEFDQTLKIGKIGTAKVRLYNPAPDTIKASHSKKVGRTREYPNISVEAGYDTDSGTTILGEIMDHKVIRKGPDQILEMQVGDKTKDWANALIGKSYVNQSASKIITDMLATVGIIGDVTLGNDKTYKSFVGKTFKQALKNIVKDTDSILYFRNGQLKIEPSTPTKDRQVLFISPTSGLIGNIGKNKKGFEFKTLFFHKLTMGDIVQIEDSRTPKATVKLVEGKKKFSTFGKAECSWKAVEI